jgi:hypothetical protein
MTVYEFISRDVPKFEEFSRTFPESYRTEMDYGMANHALRFAIELAKEEQDTELRRLFELVESGLSRTDVGDALCIDFVGRISDIAAGYETQFEKLLGPESRRCYEHS